MVHVVIKTVCVCRANGFYQLSHAINNLPLIFYGYGLGYFGMFECYELWYFVLGISDCVQCPLVATFSIRTIGVGVENSHLLEDAIHESQ
jgi:hypothetical protein